MAIHRREFFGAALSAGLLTAARGDAQGWGDPATPAAGDPDAPPFPARERLALWPGPPPGSPARAPVLAPTMNGPKGARELWLRGIAVPEVHVYRPARPNGASLLALPGGGYQFVSFQNEGLDVAQRFNALGTTVFVLAYRLPGEGWARPHSVPLQDAQRAMRLIRARAGDLRIDSARLGVVGFSAGGHLAADLAVAHDERVYDPVDAADRLSARPAFAGLVYPVTDLRIGTAATMLSGGGAAPPAAIVEARSPVRRITPAIMTSFLVHALDDPVVPLEHSLGWIAACRAAGGKVEAHLLQEGGHGFGLHLPPVLPGARWPELFAAWIARAAPQPGA
ncbi:MAG: alpha/beta hydrolase [Alphaproteobacteria bacterium]|nr:alpha/beta hydrolase [Alphaproteobacteria bacterium]MBV9370092.1 alpha/beta hydrolase [Alphaproteobacteria bacterium]MBV9901006.1 alpha/beta hydrolase [Alphaproteobacteria bacterium]